MHDDELKVPVPELVKLTVPFGVEGVPAPLLSATVTVHVVSASRMNGAAQVTVVVVARSVAVMELEVPELAVWTPELAPLGV
ncbi:MAG: hypothetical protein HY534_05295 [Chloroflexi bacterium]|nr:hypothetical protein [Chloroflexota bacterium]